jgi:SAM-dependent methyltransferase
VLDVGCAVGVATEEMQRIGLKPVGLDISEKMISYASARGLDVKFICGDFFKFKFDDLFDGLYVQSFIHLFPDPHLELAFEKLRSVLTPGGILFISTTESSTTCGGWERKADYAGSPLRFRRHWTRQDFVSLLCAQGFAPLEEWGLIDPFEKRWMIFIARFAAK